MSKRSRPNGAVARTTSPLCTKFPGTIAAADHFLLGYITKASRKENSRSSELVVCITRRKVGHTTPGPPFPRTKAPPAAEPTGSVSKPTCHSFGPGSGGSGTLLAPETFCAAQHDLGLRFVRPRRFFSGTALELDFARAEKCLVDRLSACFTVAVRGEDHPCPAGAAPSTTTVVLRFSWPEEATDD